MTIRERVRAWLGIEERQRESWTPVYPVGGGRSPSGVFVTTRAAWRLAPVRQGVEILANEVATLPLMVKRRTATGLELATNSPYWRLLHRNPEPLLSSFQWRRTTMTHVLLEGNGYTAIRRDRMERPQALQMLEPWRVQVYTDANERPVRYEYQPREGERERFLPWDIIHLPDYALNNGALGDSRVLLCADAVGLTAALEDFGALFFGQGANPSGVLEHPGELGEEAYNRLLSSWDRAYHGPTNAHKTVILEDGTTYKPTSLDPEKSQMLGTREFQVGEVARIMNIPPSKLGAKTDPYTYSSQEQEAQAFQQTSVRPWVTAWEAELALKLLPPDLQAEFNMDEALRADTAGRYTAYSTAIQAGWMRRNEARVLEGLNPIPGLDDASEPEASAEDDEARARDALALRPALEHTVRRVLDRQVRALETYMDREDPAEAVGRFFERQPEIWANELTPLLESFRDYHGANFNPAQVAKALGERFTAEHLEQIQQPVGDLAGLWDAPDITLEVLHGLAAD